MCKFLINAQLKYDRKRIDRYEYKITNFSSRIFYYNCDKNISKQIVPSNTKPTHVYFEIGEIRTLYLSFPFLFTVVKNGRCTLEDTVDDTFHLKTLKVSEEGRAFIAVPRPPSSPPGVSANFSLTRREGGSRCAREK